MKTIITTLTLVSMLAIGSVNASSSLDINTDLSLNNIIHDVLHSSDPRQCGICERGCPIGIGRAACYQSCVKEYAPCS
jgi:hypothetical protein